jgi:hypothetical protein
MKQSIFLRRRLRVIFLRSGLPLSFGFSGVRMAGDLSIQGQRQKTFAVLFKKSAIILL